MAPVTARSPRAESPGFDENDVEARAVLKEGAHEIHAGYAGADDCDVGDPRRPFGLVIGTGMRIVVPERGCAVRGGKARVDDAGLINAFKSARHLGLLLGWRLVEWWGR